MSPIRNNPYRILGVLANSTEKELQKQIAIIKRFAEVGKTKAFDYDFPFLGGFSREISFVQDAASKIEQAKNKVYYGLFWFLNNGNIDEIALNYLKENNINKAAEIWNKLINGDINTKNFSAAANLSTLNLGLITLNGSFSLKTFNHAIQLKGILLKSEAFSKFIRSVAGDNLSVCPDQANREFVDEVLQLVKPYLNRTNGLTTLQLFEAFSKYPSEIKKYLSGYFTDQPLSRIENKIEEIKTLRKENPGAAGTYGKTLYVKTIDDLHFLNSVWGRNNVQYQMITNKLAQELLQCAIDFFIEHRDSKKYDPGEKAMLLMNRGKAIGPTGQIKGRLDENIKNLQDWIDDKPKREKYRRIEVDIGFIDKKLKSFQNLSGTIENAGNLLVGCQPKLANIRAVLGSIDELYLNISSAVIGNAQGMLISAVNSSLNLSKLQASFYTVDTLKNDINKAWALTVVMNSFDMTTDLRESFRKNRDSLENIKNQIDEATTRSTSTSSSRSGCYIATMVYGDYGHPQVLILRKFRDGKLSKSNLGKSFIRFYYKYSSCVVKKLKTKTIINMIIKHQLNLLIKTLIRGTKTAKSQDIILI